LKSPLERRKSKARRPYSARTVLEELFTDLTRIVSHKATPAEMINPSQDSVQLKDSTVPIVH
jgi:hypothetical protein